ncbi:hypothetical protein TWF694_006131 [Orbilia ellipsospora]|uniref:Uncharacterized protein n=1 Tax=Orbilia ellipsospora TaxID=2528407 RepID=A0AAV9WRN0_9PEZI
MTKNKSQESLLLEGSLPQTHIFNSALPAEILAYQADAILAYQQVVDESSGRKARPEIFGSSAVPIFHQREYTSASYHGTDTKVTKARTSHRGFPNTAANSRANSRSTVSFTPTLASRNGSKCSTVVDSDYYSYASSSSGRIYYDRASAASGHLAVETFHNPDDIPPPDPRPVPDNRYYSIAYMGAQFAE